MSRHRGHARRSARKQRPPAGVGVAAALDELVGRPGRRRRRASSLRPPAHGELDDAFELFPSCAGCGQDSHAADNGSDVVGQGLGISVRREIALGTSALEALADRRGRRDGTRSGSCRWTTTRRRSRWCPERQDSRPECLDRSGYRRRRARGPRRLRAPSAARGPLAHRRRGLAVAFEGLPEQLLLVAVGGVEAGTVDAHRLSEIRERGPLVALAPEHGHRPFEAFIGVELSCASHDVY